MNNVIWRLGIDVNRNEDISGSNPIRSAVEHGIDIAAYYAKQHSQTETRKEIKNI